MLECKGEVGFTLKTHINSYEHLGRITELLYPWGEMRILSVICILISTVAGFLLGMAWEKYKLLELGPVELTTSLVLQNSPSELGSLPKGTILYPYSIGSDTDTFAVFINTKDRNILKAKKFEHLFTISPISGYRE